MTHPYREPIDRREALRRATVLLGGALSAPTIAAILDQGPTFRVLGTEQAELVATIAEHILPATDTPGARAAGVHYFVDAVLAQGLPEGERAQLLAGLVQLDALARRSCGRAFLECGAAAQRALLEQLDRDADPVFCTLKELTIVGYYTSEAGATRELRHVAVPGRFEGCVPFSQIGRTWA